MVRRRAVGAELRAVEPQDEAGSLDLGRTDGRPTRLTHPRSVGSIALYDKDGPEAAFVLGQKLKLKDGTLRSWFMVWRRKDKTAKPAKATNAGKFQHAFKDIIRTSSRLEFVESLQDSDTRTTSLDT